MDSGGSIHDPIHTTILEQIAEGVIVADEAGRITLFNRAAEEIHGKVEIGIAMEEYTSRFGLFRLDGTPYPPEELPLARAVLNGETVREAEWMVRRPDGTEVIAKGTATPVVNEDGTPAGAVLTARDVTSEARLGRELDAERKRLREAFELAPAFIATLSGPEHVFEMANHAYHELVGDREVVGRTVRQVFPELEDQGFFELLDEVFRTGDPYIGREVPILLRRGPDDELQERFLTFVYQARRSSDGEIRGILAHGIDATEQVEARREIEKLYEGVEAANRTKSEFLATISHELRTPLNAIRGYTDLLDMGQAGELPETAAGYVGRIDVSARHLLYLIDEILALTRLEAGTEKAVEERVRLEELAEELRAIGEPLAASKELDFSLTCSSKNGETTTDPGKVRQILVELLGNAIKFTHEGSVSVTCAETEEGISFEIRDTGVGIEPEDAARVFDPFWQADAGTTRRYSGTGLGLAVAGKRARLIGADISAEHREDGTTFRLLLPHRDEE